MSADSATLLVDFTAPFHPAAGYVRLGVRPAVEGREHVAMLERGEQDETLCPHGQRRCGACVDHR